MIIGLHTVQPVYFCFGAKPANSKFATKIAKSQIIGRSWKDWNFSEISIFKLSRMKGSVGLLSIAMRTIDLNVFEAIFFYQLCPVLN